MFTQLRLGAIHFYLVSPGTLATTVPPADVTYIGFAFPDAELSHQRHIELKESGTQYIENAHIAECAQRRLCKCPGAQPGNARRDVWTGGSLTGRSRVRIDLIRALERCAETKQRLIEAGRDAQRSSGPVRVNRRSRPAG